MEGRIPPQNLDAEMSVLGSMMLDSEAKELASEEVRAEDFYKPAHRKIFEVIIELSKKGEPTDLLLVDNALRNKGEHEAFGGAGYLAEILNHTPTGANVKHHARIVREKSLLRRMISAGQEIVQKAYDNDFDDVGGFIDSAEKKILEVAEERKTEGLSAAGEIVSDSIKKIEELAIKKASLTGISSGFQDLDRMTAGFQPEELIIIAARPSMGKTAFSLNLATHAAIRQKKTVAYFSVEMGKSQMMMRVLASESQLNMSDMRLGRIADGAWQKLFQTANAVAESPLYIDDTSGISPFEIRSKVRRLQATRGLDMIMVDYLQIMDLKQKVESRERAVSEISKTLKQIAKEFKVPVIALAQLNRSVEGRSDRRPMLSDLRESGSIEQDADVIMMLYREDYYDRENSEQKGVAEVIIGKQRNGPTGTVKLAWSAQHGTFSNLAPDSMIAPPPMRNSSPNRPSGEIPNFAPKS